MNMFFKPEDFLQAGIAFSMCGLWTTEEINNFQSLISKIANDKVEILVDALERIEHEADNLPHADALEVCKLIATNALKGDK